MTQLRTQELDINGYIVLEVFSQEQMREISKAFLTIAINAPELVQPIQTPITRFVMGCVGYCPFASVAYHPLTRSINRAVYATAQPIFEEILANDETLYLSMLPDRPLVRFPEQIVVEKGKWHQDDAANATEEFQDRCYGGWINLNCSEMQYFKAIPGTHKPDHPIFESLEQKDGGRRGFANFKEKKDYDFLENYWKTHYGNENLIKIPPGHVLIFRETLIHTVYKNPPTKNCILRMHTSFMTSRSPVPLHDRPTNAKYAREPIMNYFRQQMVVPVRSGQSTPVYSPMNLYPKSRPQLEALSAQYISACKNGALVLRELPSLARLTQLTNGKISMHPQMNEEEIEIFIPHKL